MRSINIKTYRSFLNEQVEWNGHYYYIPKEDGEYYDLGNNPNLTRRNFSATGDDLSSCKLQNCDLSFSNFSQCTLEYADLEGANLTGCNISFCDFSDAILKNSKGLETCDGIMTAKFHGADFTGVSVDFFSIVVEEIGSGEEFDKFFYACYGIPDKNELEFPNKKYKRTEKAKNLFGI